MASTAKLAPEVVRDPRVNRESEALVDQVETRVLKAIVALRAHRGTQVMTVLLGFLVLKAVRGFKATPGPRGLKGAVGHLVRRVPLRQAGTHTRVPALAVSLSPFGIASMVRMMNGVKEGQGAPRVGGENQVKTKNLAS